MKRWLAKLELPLFARELRELAAKKRTYGLRVLYSLILFWIGIGVLGDQLVESSSVRSQFGMMGNGDRLFEALFVFQIIAIHVMTPALVCSAITNEKERNTLGILLLTRLGPWRILFEKLCSRLLPVLTCVLLSVPILALSYSLGGLSWNPLVNGLILLLLTSVQIGCMTLMCSSFFRTMTGAFIASYLIQLVLAFCVFATGMINMRAMRRGFVETSFFEDAVLGLSGYSVWYGDGNSSPAELLLSKSRWIVLSALTFFVLARVFLVRRASVKSKSRVMAFFKLLDRFFVWSNQLTGGITLVGDVGSLPEDKPIAWREVTKKSLGTARYLFRVFLALEIPTAFFCVAASGMGNFRGEYNRLAGLSCGLWALSSLIVMIKAAGLIASERSSETLDVLLTTPLTAKEIVSQKCAGLRRVLFVTSLPLLTAIGFSAYMKGFPRSEAAIYTVWGILQVVVYLQLIAWASIWVGMRMKTQTRSIFAAMTVFVIVMATPYILFKVGDFVDLFGTGNGLETSVYALVLLSGPSAGLVANEFANPYNQLGDLVRWAAVVVPVHIGFYATLTFFIRRRVLSIAAARLGRGEAGLTNATESPDAAASPNRLEPTHALS
jgi:ABC-type transport system involved in multi-copper enzyme maturation permease subunit